MSQACRPAYRPHRPHRLTGKRPRPAWPVGNTVDNPPLLVDFVEELLQRLVVFVLPVQVDLLALHGLGRLPASLGLHALQL